MGTLRPLIVENGMSNLGYSRCWTNSPIKGDSAFPAARAWHDARMVVVVFFIVHWQLSLFCQSFFLHRYGAHRQFTMSKGGSGSSTS